MVISLVGFGHFLVGIWSFLVGIWSSFSGHLVKNFWSRPRGYLFNGHLVI